MTSPGTPREGDDEPVIPPTTARQADDVGSLLARVLSGAWRKSQFDPNLLAADLTRVMPHVLRSGTAGLVWTRIEGTSLDGTREAEQLRQTHRLQTVHNALMEHEIQRVVNGAHEIGIDPLVIKGWAVARLYATPALRPYGDLDLAMDPEDHARFDQSVAALAHLRCRVDVQRGIMHMLPGRTWEEVNARTRRVQLGQTGVRVLCAEDQLALLCMHFFKHGGWRPLWLCDISVAVESCTPDFDWDVCLGNDPVRGGWIVCALRLAQSLLDAHLSGLPRHLATYPYPAWLRCATLKAWRNPFVDTHPETLEPLRLVARRPWNLPRALSRRWKNPIEVSVWYGVPFNDGRRLPWQVRHYLEEIPWFLRHGGRATPR